MLFLKTDIKIIKITIGVLISLIFTYALGLNEDVTAPIAVIIVMVLSDAIHSTRGNLVDIILSNVIGIGFGIISYLIFPNYIIAVTLSVLISMIVANIIPFEVSLITTPIGAILTVYLFSIDSPILYNKDRLILVIIGGILGYIINILIYPPCYKEPIRKAIDKTSHTIFNILEKATKEDFNKIFTSKDLRSIHRSITEINTNISIFNKDLNLKRKESKEDLLLLYKYEELTKLLESSYNIIYKLFYFSSRFNKMADEDKTEFSSIVKESIGEHRKVLSSIYSKKNHHIDLNIDLETFSTDCNYTMFKGSVIEYYLELKQFIEDVNKKENIVVISSKEGLKY